MPGVRRVEYEAGTLYHGHWRRIHRAKHDALSDKHYFDQRLHTFRSCRWELKSQAGKWFWPTTQSKWRFFYGKTITANPGKTTTRAGENGKAQGKRGKTRSKKGAESSKVSSNRESGKRSGSGRDRPGPAANRRVAAEYSLSDFRYQRQITS